MPLGGAGATNLEQLQALREAGLIDAATMETIEATMANPTAELDRLHASGLMSDEIYAQALASMPAASASDAAAEAAERELLLSGEAATATVLFATPPSAEATAQLSLKLEVHPGEGAPYEVECSVPAGHPGRQPQAGDFLPVKVDPDDREHVAVDWSGFGA